MFRAVHRAAGLPNPILQVRHTARGGNYHSKVIKNNYIRQLKRIHYYDRLQ